MSTNEVPSKKRLIVSDRKDLSLKKIYEYNAIQDPADCLKFLLLQLNLDASDENTAIIQDLYFYTLSFARDQAFTPEQVSVFFTIVKETHGRVVESPFIRLEKDYLFFKSLVLKHCVHRPPMSQKMFSSDEMMKITEYVTNTYFRHYLMYKYVFTKKLKLDFAIEDTANSTLGISDDSREQDQILEQQGPSAKIESAEPKADEIQANSVALEAEKVPTSKRDLAIKDLKDMIASSLSPKLEELKNSLNAKLSAQDEVFVQKLKKLDEEQKKDPKKTGKK